MTAETERPSSDATPAREREIREACEKWLKVQPGGEYALVITAGQAAWLLDRLAEARARVAELEGALEVPDFRAGLLDSEVVVLRSVAEAAKNDYTLLEGWLRYAVPTLCGACVKDESDRCRAIPTCASRAINHASALRLVAQRRAESAETAGRPRPDAPSDELSDEGA